MRRACTYRLADGRRCGATPQRDGPLCFWHDPDKAEAVAEARRLGGLRRRREKALAAAFEFEGIGSIGAVQRVVEIALLDSFGLDNSIARCRILISAAQVAAKLLEVGDLADRIAALEAATGGPTAPPATPFPDGPDEQDEAA